MRNLFFLHNKNCSGWQSRCGGTAQDATGDPGSLCLCVPSSLVCGSHSHGQKMAPETLCTGRTLKTEIRGKAKEAFWLTLLPFKELSRKLELNMCYISYLVRLLTREIG